MSPVDRKNSITTFRRSFNNFELNLKNLLLDQPFSGSSLEESLIPIFKSLGLLEKNGDLSPIGKLLKEEYRKNSKVNFLILRIQIIYYFQERDFKPLSLDILNFISNKVRVNKQEIVNFLEREGYILGDNPLQSLGYFMPYLEKLGYVEIQNGNYYIPERAKNSINTLLDSFIYKRKNIFTEEYYQNKYLRYYKSDKILDKILFFRYGLENE